MQRAWQSVAMLMPPLRAQSAVIGMLVRNSTREIPRVPTNFPVRISPGLSRQVCSITKVRRSRSEVMALAVKPAVSRIMKVSSVPRKMVNSSLLLASEKIPLRGQSRYNISPRTEAVPAAPRMVLEFRDAITNSRCRIGLLKKLRINLAIGGKYLR